jgi:ADP-ribose pyrophosphatase YjhB (NUDIX family)
MTSAAVKHCTECGGRLANEWFESDRRFRGVCGVCHSIHYENPRVLVWCYVYWNDMVIFCRRAHPPATGRWALPGGFVEKGETLEEAVIREVHEETGILLDPQSVALFRVTSLPHMNEVYVEFRSELTASPVFEPGPEALEVAIFKQANVPRDQFAFVEMLPNYPDEFYQCIRLKEFPVRSTTVRSRQDGLSGGVQ